MDKVPYPNALDGKNQSKKSGHDDAGILYALASSSLVPSYAVSEIHGRDGKKRGLVSVERKVISLVDALIVIERVCGVLTA